MSNLNFDDKHILTGCLKNELRCQKLLYERYKTAMFTHCLRYAVDRAEAEDMLQEGFVLVFKKLNQFDPEKGVIGAWMRKVIINCALQNIRKKKVAFSEITVTEEEIATSHDDAVAQLGLKELLSHIQKLPTGYRTVFNMYVIDGMQHNEIAEILQISSNTSKTQLFKAKLMLQKMINESQLING